jgi:hypothetical protein
VQARKRWAQAVALVQNNMKMRKPFIYLLLVLSLLPLLPTRAFSEELDFINRPLNAIGLTGLLMTTSPFSLEPGAVETGISIISENSKIPDYTLSEYAALISVGTGKGTELAIRGCSFSKKSPTAASERGAGDVEVSFKWNFLKTNPESPSVPAVAMIMTGIAPTGDTKTGRNRVQNWGARFGFSAGTDIGWREHILGIYVDAQLAVQDLSDERYRDRYHTLHAGMLFPISKYRNLQVLIEYAAVSGKDVINIDGSDYTAFTYGLRLVSERLNLTVGTQFMYKEKEVEGYDNSERIIGMLSAKF